MTKTNAIQSLTIAHDVATNVGGLIDAIMEDLGESPEAMRGALVVCSAMRALSQAVVGAGTHDDDDDAVEAQIMGTGIAVTATFMALGERINNLIGGK